MTQNPKIMTQPKSTHAQLKQSTVANHLIINDSAKRRQVYLVVLTAVFLFILLVDRYSLDVIIIDPTSSSLLRKPHSNMNNDHGGILTVISRYPHPIVLATLRGYDSTSDMCNSDKHIYNTQTTEQQQQQQQQQWHNRTSDDDGALSKLTLLSSEDTISGSKHDVHDGSAFSFVQIVATKVHNSYINATTKDTEQQQWKTQFHLSVNAPPSQSQYTNGVNNLCYTVHYRVEYVNHRTSLADYPSELCSFVGYPVFYTRWDSRYFVETNDRQLQKQDSVHIHNNANWLVRKSADEEWQWIDNNNNNNDDDGSTSSFQCQLSWEQERPYSLVIIGDSQPSYTCHHLLDKVLPMGGNSSSSKAKDDDAKVRCVTIKQTLQNSTTFHQYSHELHSSTEDYVIFNPSGLWEAAYGSLHDFRINLHRLLTHVPTRTKKTTRTAITRQYYFLAPTTAVHPINYPNLTYDDKKWSMTQPRVRAVNSIAEELILSINRQRGLNASNRATPSSSLTTILAKLPVPWDEISLSREDDPMTLGDMRHYNVSTNELLLSSLLCKLDEIWNNG
eukprot:scaffold45506_cov23-Cyclotella_meneghiniana.AAC.4